MMYRAINWQTKECLEGTWDELCDLDNRLWDLEEVHVASHNPNLELPVIGYVEAIAVTPMTTYLGVSDKPMWLPVTYQDIMERKSQNA